MKRSDALRKTRTICERLDQIELESFPIVPFKLYLFGSVLTDKPDPRDVDLALLYTERPDLDPMDIAMRLASHKPLPFDQASTQLRRGLQRVQLFPAPRLLDTWEYVLLFPRGEGLQLIWKAGLNWPRVLDEITAQPVVWLGPRPADARERFEEWRDTLPAAEKQARIVETLAALEVQEKRLDKGLGDKP